MRWSIPLSVSFLLLLLSGCEPVLDALPALGPIGAVGGREAPLAAPLAESCSDQTWIGLRLAGGLCPQPGRSSDGFWQVEAPFSRADDAHMQAVCQYRWISPRRLEPDVSVLPDQADLRLERDCDVVVGHAAPEAVSAALQTAWRDQMELPDWRAAAPFDTSAVQVAVIDGGFHLRLEPRRAARLGQDHPVAVSSVIRAIACPDLGEGAFCAAGTPNYPALPYIRRGIIAELGGRLGALSDYAIRVVGAVDDWRGMPDAIRPARLILNLSLGWDQQHTSRARLASWLAERATRYATCQGALLIAAAGNRAHDADRGPMLPAAFADQARGCGAMPDGPLVYPVGGVDGRDRALSVSRPEGTPRLVAPAAWVSVPIDTVERFGGSTAVMTGTSMAAAAASGAAALIWGLDPQRSADDVMALLYASGEPLGRPAEFGLAGEQRRLSVGRALGQLCAEVPDCLPAASAPVLPPARAAGIDAQAPIDVVLGALLAEAEVMEPVPEAAPPEGESAFVSPWVGPQPGVPNCPVCGVLESTLVGRLTPPLHGAFGKLRVVWFDARGRHVTGVRGLPVDAPFAVDLGEVDGPLLGAWLEAPIEVFGKTLFTRDALIID